MLTDSYLNKKPSEIKLITFSSIIHNAFILFSIMINDLKKELKKVINYKLFF